MFITIHTETRTPIGMPSSNSGLTAGCVANGGLLVLFFVLPGIRLDVPLRKT